MHKFILKKVKLYDDFFGNVELELESNNIEEKELPFTNVIIGENGVGKSIILNKISTIFIDLEVAKENREIDLIIEKNKNTKNLSQIEILELKKKKKRRRNIKLYNIEYNINGNNYRIDKEKIITVYKNEVVIDISDLELPNKILTCSFLVNDKFPYVEESNIYKYLGIRSTNYSTNRTSIASKVVNNILNNSNKKEFIEGLNNIFNLLQLGKEINIKYELKDRKKFYVGEMTEEIFIKYFRNKWRNRKVAAFGASTLERLIENKHELTEIVEFINRIIKYNSKDKYITFRMNLEYSNINDSFRENLNFINTLIKLDVLKVGNLLINGTSEYGFDDASSGEMHIIFLATNILANVEENSLIIIDEPEISLHPKLIMKFIHIIRMLLVNHSNCQIIVATHSHFIVSDLDDADSKLIIFRKENNRIICENLEYNTYGWSAENILYKVFGVPSCRNYYLSKEIEDILKKLMLGQKSDILKDLSKLEAINSNLSEADPLKIIVQEILKEVK